MDVARTYTCEKVIPQFRKCGILVVYGTESTESTLVAVIGPRKCDSSGTRSDEISTITLHLKSDFKCNKKKEAAVNNNMWDGAATDLLRLGKKKTL